jgi:hypothetical protein
LVNNILRNRTDGSLTLTNQTLLQNFKDSILFAAVVPSESYEMLLRFG